ncbi:hypothetical protein RHSIM_Rhsim05G0037700 [Rhododendron simsii]|uniref:AP2/ERF domain-containing protein n=1 Tax=Rhododendron simsii TaxID=118357 RepID=A0A834LPA8_RHOSS|nr:hypothetical protein RHSIM_Rhsim05G0037700 [Rhododendron simsii]
MDSRPVAVQLPVAKTVYLPTSMDHCDNQVFDAVDRCSTTITDGKDGMHFRVMCPRPWGSYAADIWDPSKKSRVWFDPVEEEAWAKAAAAREFRGVKAKLNFPPAEEEIGNPETKKKGNRNQSPSASNTAIPVESSSREGLEEELRMDPEDTGVISDWLRRYCGKGCEELGMDPENTSIISDLRFIYRAITTGVLHVIENSNDARLKGNLPHVYAVKRTLEYLLSFAILLTAWILLIEDTPLKKLDRSNDWGFWNMVNLVRNVDALDETLWLLPHRRSTHPNLNTWDDKAISVSEETIKKVSKSESR